MGAEPIHRVSGWLGEHLIIDYVGSPAAAVHFEDALRHDSTILRVTNEPATDVVTAAARLGHRLGDDR